MLKQNRQCNVLSSTIAARQALPRMEREGKRNGEKMRREEEREMDDPGRGQLRCLQFYVKNNSVT